jgi:4-hydroxybenzoate polyprenyltransferase
MMSPKKPFDFLIFFNIYLAIGAGIITYSFSTFFIGAQSIELFIIPFLMTFSMYGLNRLTDMNEDSINNASRVQFILKYKKQMSISLSLAYILATILALNKNLGSFYVSLIVLFIGITYSVPLISFGKYKRLKDIPFIKNLVIGLIWGLVLILFPMYYLSSELTSVVVILFIFIIARLIINTTLFDLRDIAGDKKAKISTLATSLGIKKTLMFTLLMNLFILLLLLVSVYFGYLPPEGSILIISVIYSLFYIKLIGKIDTGFLCNYVIDGEFILLGLLPFIANL